MTLGNLYLHSLSDGFFGLDGGAMFGVVPRPLWQKTNPPDDRNRIRLALRPLLVVTPSERILIDSGIGDKYDAEFADVYRIEKTDTIEGSLARAGFRPEDVTKVVLTHLHFDHAGGATRFDSHGRPVPRFAKARYYVQRREWDLAVNPNRRSRASYLKENFLPLEEAGQLELVDGDTELVPGVKLIRTGGHTPGHQVVQVQSAGETAFYWADMIPTRAHIAVPYVMGYDLYPVETMELKEKLVQQAAQEGWVSFLEHDPDHAAGRIIARGDKWMLEPVPVEEPPAA